MAPAKKKAAQAGEGLCQNGNENYVLRLYVTGLTPNSTRAIANAKALCEKHLHGRYDLEIIDIYQQPMLAKGEQIIATPTLIKKLPTPLRHLVGDLSNVERVLMGLDLHLKPDEAAATRSQSRPNK